MDHHPSFNQSKNKMDELIELVSTIKVINERKPSDDKLREVTGELNQVVDRCTRLAYDYVRNVCDQENTRPDKSIGESLSSKRLDKLLDRLRPRCESISEYRKFEKLTENNQAKVEALNKVIDELSGLPINEKVKNLKVGFQFYFFVFLISKPSLFSRTAFRTPNGSRTN